MGASSDSWLKGLNLPLDTKLMFWKELVAGNLGALKASSLRKEIGSGGGSVLERRQIVN